MSPVEVDRSKCQLSTRLPDDFARQCRRYCSEATVRSFVLEFGLGGLLVGLLVTCSHDGAGQVEADAASRASPLSSSEPQAQEVPLRPLPYTVAARALDGCRNFNSPGCAYCARVDYSGHKHLEGKDNPRLSPDEIPPGVNVANCAQCMSYDENALRSLVPRLKECDCSSVVHVGGLVDACFAPTSCRCVCREWIRTSLRCPPAVVTPSMANRFNHP